MTPPMALRLANSTDNTEHEGAVSDLSGPDLIPAYDLPPDATPEQVMDALNGGMRLLRALQNMRAEGGMRVLFSTERILLTAGGEQGSPLGDPAAPSQNANAGYGPGIDDTGQPPVTYELLAAEYMPPEGAITYTLRQRTTTAELVGYDEFIASTPPKKYLRRTLSGSLKSLIYEDDDPATPKMNSGGSASGTLVQNLGGEDCIHSISMSQAAGTVTWTYDVAGPFNPPLPNTPPFARVFTAWAGGTPGGALGSVVISLSSRNDSNPTFSTSGSFSFAGERVVIACSAIDQRAGFNYAGPSQELSLAATQVEESIFYTGAATIDPLTEVATDAGELSGQLFDTALDDLDDVSATGLNSVTHVSTLIGSLNFGSQELTATSRRLTPSGNIVQIGIATRWREVTECTLTDTLTEEDTEEAATLRASGSWGSPAALGTLPQTVASATQRTTGFTWTTTEGELTVAATGLPNSTSLIVVLYGTQVSLLTTAESPAPLIEATLTTDAIGNGSVVIPIVAAPGFARKIYSIGFFI